MTRSVLLDNVTHKDLRVVTTRGAAWGDDLMSCIVFPGEFRSVQAHYPIAFQKTGEGSGFQPVAVFGFEPGRNLFLGPDGWDAGYLPMALERQPFLIGRDGEELLVHIDLDSPRIGLGEGEPVFLPHGGAAPLLERLTSLLLALHEGVQALPAFIGTLLEHELLESFVLDAQAPDGSQSRLAGLYTIDEERLQRLPGAVLEQLSRDGHLLPIYMALAATARWRDLVERQQRRSAA